MTITHVLFMFVSSFILQICFFYLFSFSVTTNLFIGLAIAGVGAIIFGVIKKDPKILQASGYVLIFGTLLGFGAIKLLGA